MLGTLAALRVKAAGWSRSRCPQPFTYDILPDSDSGTYFAGGTLIGSTLCKVGFAATVKWLPQISAENTLKGNYVWFKLGVSF